MDVRTFVPHKKGSNDQSVWKFFLTQLNGDYARCIKCMAVVRAAGSSTSSLHKHMLRVHQINTLKRLQSNNFVADISEVDKRVDKRAKITDYYTVDGETLQEVICRMAALDVIPFHLFCDSIDIRKGLLARGFNDIPKSPNTIREMILNYANNIRKSLVNTFYDLKSKGKNGCRQYWVQQLCFNSIFLNSSRFHCFFYRSGTIEQRNYRQKEEIRKRHPENY